MLKGMTVQGRRLSGSVHPDFLRVAEVFAGQLPRSGSGGAALCIYHRGEKVVDVWGGTRDASGRPWKQDTLALSYSTSKGITSTLLHICVDRGLLDYDDPVCEYWPEFASGGKQDVTVRQLLCHEAGLFDIRSLVDKAERMLDWDYMTGALAAATPCHPPGKSHGYHGFTYGWLVGELIRRVTGKPFSEVLEAELVRPLGLDGCYIGLPADQMRRRARLLLPGAFSAENDLLPSLERYVRPLARLLSVARLPIDFASLGAALVPRGIERLDWNSDAFASVPIPAANGCFTARSLARVYALLANDGELDGVRLLRRDTVWRASEIQNRGIGRVIPVPMHWRLGYHRVPTLGTSPQNAFGHFGFGGSGAFCDPDRELAVAMTVNHGIGTPFGDLRMVRLGTAAIRCAGARAST
jgi:CubicO group peptidase (beta-lactamase class C family)